MLKYTIESAINGRTAWLPCERGAVTNGIRYIWGYVSLCIHALLSCVPYFIISCHYRQQQEKVSIKITVHKSQFV